MAELHPPDRPKDDVNGKLHDLLATLWMRSQHAITERLQVLHHSHRTLCTTPSDANARRAGADAAHKLAGILGTFGLPAGTELARRIEVTLESSAALRTFDVDMLQQSIQQLEAMIEEKSRTAGKRRA